MCSAAVPVSQSALVEIELVRARKHLVDRVPEERLRLGAAAVQPAPLLPDRHETGVAQEPDVSGDGGRVETEEVDEDDDELDETTTMQIERCDISRWQ